MSQAPLRPPPTSQPRPKAIPTFSSTSVGAISRSGTPQLSRPPSLSRHPSPNRAATLMVDGSDKAAAALIRRVLCPNTHSATDKERLMDELLPPLTSNNDVNFQSYAIVAIIVKELLHSWYGKITTDQTFVEEVVRTIAHCTRALESRLRHVDLESLVLDEIPALVETHIHAFRVAHDCAQSPGLSTDAKVIYHDLNPHPALGPIPYPQSQASIEEQARNEATYRQLLAQGTLAILLPAEDLENACLRTLIADVIAGPVIGNSVGDKVCESWFIWGSLTRLVVMAKAKLQSRATGEEVEHDPRGRLKKFGLLAEKEESTTSRRTDERSAFSSAFWRVLQYGYLAFTITRFILVALFSAHSRPSRSSTVPRAAKCAIPSPTAAQLYPAFQPVPILDFRVFPLLSQMVDLPQRMPWLSGILALVRRHLTEGWLKRMGGTDKMVDQCLHHLLQTHLSPSQLLPQILSRARQSLFPQNGLPPPSAPPPTPEQLQQIKKECAESIVSLLPPFVCKRLLGPAEEQWVREVEVELEVWEDGWMNKHLGYRILELMIVRVLPELGETAVSDLMEGRLPEPPQ